MAQQIRVPINSDADTVTARQQGRALAAQLGLSLEGAETALDLEEGLSLLKQRTRKDGKHGGANTRSH